MYSTRPRRPWRRPEGRTTKQELLHILRGEERPYVTSRFPFQRLPPEIRNIIYHFHLLQAQDQTHLRRWDDGLSARAKAAIQNWEDFDCLPAPYEYPALSILAVSRQVYEEALGIFYHYNTLQLQTVTDLRDFLSSIGSRRRAFIRDIEFSYEGTAAAAAFKLLGTCKNLTKLHIRTSILTLSGSKRNLLEAYGFGQLLKIRGLETVEISHPKSSWFSNKRRFRNAVRNALLQPRQAIKERKGAGDSKRAFKGKKVAAGKKRTIEDGKAPKAKKAKLVHDLTQVVHQPERVEQDT